MTEVVFRSDPSEMQDFIENFDPEWSTTQDGQCLICPCGNVVTLGGTCPNGHQSPLGRAFTVDDRDPRGV